MTNLFDDEPVDRPLPPRRPTQRKGPGRLIAVLVVLLLAGGLVAGGAYAVRTVFGSSAPEDFEGSGAGEAVVQILPGDNAGDVGARLLEKGVIASRAAFFEVAREDTRSTTLQPGFYKLRQKMSAEAALDLLLDPAAKVVGRVTVPEGLTVPQTLKVLAKGTGTPLAEYEAAAKDTAALGLPAYAKGNLEGFLFPATYEVEPGSKPEQVLGQMIARFEQAAQSTGLEEGAKRLGLTPYEVVIVASLIEREVKKDDEYGQVARVVYNRLEEGIPLGIDAATAFGVGKTAGEPLTRSDLAKDTPYENRRKTGLPPTPIASPGEATLQGALDPVDGDILYYVLASKDGTTFFTSDYQAFLRQKKKSLDEGVF